MPERTIEDYMGPFGSDDEEYEDDENIPSWADKKASKEEITDAFYEAADIATGGFTINYIISAVYDILYEKCYYATEDRIEEVVCDILDYSSKYILIDYKKKEYVEASNLKLANEDIEKIRECLSKLFSTFKETNALTMDKVVERIQSVNRKSKHFEKLMGNRQLLFQRVKESLKKEYRFVGDKYIVRKNSELFKINNDDDILIDYLKNFSRIDSEKISDYRATMMLSNGMTFVELTDYLKNDYVQTEANEMVNKESLGKIDESIIDNLKDVLKENYGKRSSKELFNKIKIYYSDFALSIESTTGREFNKYLLVGLLRTYMPEDAEIAVDSNDYRVAEYYVKGKENGTEENNGFIFID